MSDSGRLARIAIEGNIGAGKSTLLSLLARSVDFLVVPEPLNKWQVHAFARARKRPARLFANTRPRRVV